MICTVFFSTFTAFFFPQSHWLLCHEPCPSSPARGGARAALPSLRGWEIFGRKPITHLCPPLLACRASAGSWVVLGLLASLQEDIWQHLACLSGKFGQFLLSAWWKTCQGCPRDAELAETRTQPRADAPTLPPWDKVARNRRFTGNSLPFSPPVPLFSVLFWVGFFFLLWLAVNTKTSIKKTRSKPAKLAGCLSCVRDSSEAKLLNIETEDKQEVSIPLVLILPWSFPICSLTQPNRRPEVPSRNHHLCC